MLHDPNNFDVAQFSAIHFLCTAIFTCYISDVPQFPRDTLKMYRNFLAIHQRCTARIENILQGMSKEEQEKTAIFVTAHSLPVAALNGCPYKEQIEHTAKLIQEQLSNKNVYVAWQSAAVGSKPGTWLEPYVLDLTREVVEKNSYTSVVYAPVGFIADHLEVLFDNDVECKQVAEELGVNYYRPEMPNTDPMFIEGLGKHLISMCTHHDWKSSEMLQHKGMGHPVGVTK